MELGQYYKGYIMPVNLMVVSYKFCTVYMPITIFINFSAVYCLFLVSICS